MKATDRQLKTTDYTEYTDKNTKSCRDTEHRVPRHKSKTARRRQFMREYRKLYKETKRFVDEVLRQNSPQKPALMEMGDAKGARKNLDGMKGLRG